MSNDSPQKVFDTFHYSSYYWREFGQTDETKADVPDGEGLKYRSPSFSGNMDEYMNPKPVNNDRIKLKFYAHVLGDASENIHFGKWDGIDLDQPGAFGRAGDAMTKYMFNLSLSLLPHRAEADDFRYIDLGSGSGAAALNLVQNNKMIEQATCLNLCHEQNEQANDRASELGLSNRINTIDASFDNTPCEPNCYDMAFSQDAFVHAREKLVAFTEAYRITKPGGALVFCDILCGDNPDLTTEELAVFSENNRINDWLNPSSIVKTCSSAGWKDVKFVDLTTDLRISFQLMLKKVKFILEHGDVGDNQHGVQLRNYHDSICRRITQIDRGVFKWGVIHGRKPVCMDIVCKPPVPFIKTNHLILSKNEEEGKMQGTNVVVVDILSKMTEERIKALPKSIEVLITMSAGLDHIDMRACAERGIVVKQSGRDQITSHVVQYVLGFLIVGLRDALNQLGVSFPSSGWNLSWNCEGKPLTKSTIAIVGMGFIAKGLVTEIRKLAPDTRIVYHVPSTMRDFDAESNFNLEYVPSLKELAACCDVLLPLCPLTKHTEHIINKEVLDQLQPHAGFINMSRGKIVDTDALTETLRNKKIKYAILDTTFPEPLPADHPLWTTEKCFILPHYATNTMAVREALVSDIQPIIEDHFGLGHSDERRKAEEKAIRYDLAVAHRLTAKYGMDMLVWNHISARFRNGCLVTPGRKMWSSINPSDLVYSSSNVTADIIHEGIYSARRDIKAIIHLHTPAATAVSCLEGGFQTFTQDSAYFYGKVANYDWDGVSDDASEGPKITAAVQAVEGCNTLLMNNHGFTCFGSSVREVWVLAYYFERCCETQLRLMQSGGKIRMPPKAMLQKAAEASYLPEFAPGVQEWEALCEEISFD
jgi:lactate dehydrogenase-like 2-hydroxyacid dehydrogenase/ribulose-5-phosphate 4-epimerase/fuculose-1-phosphate aldolase/SAM-dependent methyltransferase